MQADNGGSARPVFGRVLLKLSGEALMGDREYGVDPRTVTRIAREQLGLPLDPPFAIHHGDARRLFFSSITYLPLLWALMIVVSLLTQKPAASTLAKYFGGRKP